MNARPEESTGNDELSRREQKRLATQQRIARANRKRELTMKVNRIEREIARLEEQHAQIVSRLEDPALYGDSTADPAIRPKMLRPAQQCCADPRQGGVSPPRSNRNIPGCPRGARTARRISRGARR